MYDTQPESKSTSNDTSEKGFAVCKSSGALK